MPRRSPLALAGLILLLAVLGCLTHAFFEGVDARLEGADPWAAARAGLDPRQALKFPLFAVAGALGCCLVEILAIGWGRSSLRRLLVRGDASTRTDWFYVLIGLSGVKKLLGFVLTLGVGYCWAEPWIRAHLGAGWLAHAGFAPQYLALFLLNTLAFYWVHRLMHSRWLWEIHKVHHAAVELGVLANYRNHPVDGVFASAIKLLPAVLLGIGPEVLFAYTVQDAIYQEMAHAEWNWECGWVTRHLFISSAAHRVHHDTDPVHWNRNFGITPFWDRLFGTWQPPEPVKAFGLPQEGHLNRGRPLAELFDVYGRWLRGLVRA